MIWLKMNWYQQVPGKHKLHLLVYLNAIAAVSSPLEMISQIMKWAIFRITPLKM